MVETDVHVTWGVGMAEDKELVEELQPEVNDKRRVSLLAAYAANPTAAAIATKALEILAEDIDAIDKP